MTLATRLACRTCPFTATGDLAGADTHLQTNPSHVLDVQVVGGDA